MFERSYIVSMLNRLLDVQPNFTIFRVNGKKWGYNSCCVDLYDRLRKVRIRPSMFMDYFFGEDAGGVQHVRCPDCRVYSGPVNLDKFVCRVRIGGIVENRTRETVMAEIGRDIRILTQVCGYKREVIQ